MIGRRQVLLLLGTTALCANIVVSTSVGDGRLPFWRSVFEDVRHGLVVTADEAGRAVGSWHVEKRPAQATSNQVAANPDPTVGAPSDDPDDAPLQKSSGAPNVPGDKFKALGLDPTGVNQVLAAYRKDDLAAGDALAQKVSDPMLRTALEWVALRTVSQKITLDRLNAFKDQHPDWPSQVWFKHQSEARLLRIQDARSVESFFVKGAPETALGKFALAKALKADGRLADATKLARAIFRESDLTGFLEGRLKAEFDIGKSDYKYRADRLLYKEQIGSAMRYAALAGPDVLALAKARAAVIAEAPSDKAIADVPESLRKDPGLLLAQVQKLRRDNKLMDAANLMQSAPKQLAQLIDGDEWWIERRVLARKLLDDGRINAAYVICATHAPASKETEVEAEFHAGWIALRFMNDPTRAAYHLNVAAKIAENATAVARIAYWQARTAESAAGPDATRQAEAFYKKAAEYSSTYYGQLSREALGLTGSPVQEVKGEATGTDRDIAVRVVEALYAAGEKESAFALAVDAAKNLKDEKQVAALSTVIAHQQDAHLALGIGKLISQRGFPDALAFPTFGIPRYDALQNSAPPSVVYSVARQESAFMPGAVSKAGAKGLMQMIDATARRTATKAGLPFDAAKLISDPAFNAKLGAAHLGELIAEQGGSYILTFAAYNAGGGNVKRWIDAYGDPRSPGVDKIDWVERIPFTETRNYVQRVIANMNMYEAIFANEQRKTIARADREAKL